MRKCTACQLDKPPDAFAPDRRRPSGLQGQCRACQRARYNTPAHKALCRRRSGQTSAPYVTRPEISCVAGIKRRLREDASIYLTAAREDGARARAVRIKIKEAGSEAWRSTATVGQIAAYDEAMRRIAARALQPSRKPMKIPLSGSLAAEGFDHALVDPQDHDFLSKNRWKAKLNGSGSGVYAVRNVRRSGKWITIRMHREILGLNDIDGLDPDHRDGQTLNNVMSNLHPVTKSQNCRNTARVRSAFPSSPPDPCANRVPPETGMHFLGSPLA